MALRIPSLRAEPIGFANRGARAHAPENTAESFDLAVKLGATGVQTDVWVTRDGELALSRAGHIGLRRRKIRTLERSGLPEKILTLPELVDRVPDTTSISIDVCDDTTFGPLLDWALTLDPIGRERLYLCHRDWRFLAEHREIDPHVRLINTTSVKTMDRGPERRAHDLTQAGIDGVNLRYSEWTGGMVTLFHRFERLCFGWDAQHRRMLDELLRIGLDGVSSDNVDLMMEAIGEHLAKGAPGDPTV